MVVRPYLVMVLAVVACGGGGSTADAPRIPDAPLGFDATPDANVPPFAHVFAYTRDGTHVPQAGLTVWSSHPDGTVDEETRSAADGSATVHVDPGGGVTVVYGSGAQTILDTVLDVNPGDVLQFGVVQVATQAPITGTITLVWPDYPGADLYFVTNGRFGENVFPPTTTSTLFLADDIPNPIDLVVHAYAGDQLIAVAHLLDTTTVDGGVYMFTEWRPAVAHAISVDGVPPGLPIGDLFADFYTVNTQDVGLGGNSGIQGEDTSSDHAIDLVMPASDYSTTVALWGSAYLGNGDSRAINFYMRSPVPASGPIMVPLDPPSVLSQPTYDPISRRGTWVRDSTGIDDTISFSLSPYPGIGPTWVVRGRGDRTDVTFPEPPADQVDVPTGTPLISAGADNEHALATYDDVKATPEWELGPTSFGVASYSASQVLAFPP